MIECAFGRIACDDNAEMDPNSVRTLSSQRTFAVDQADLVRQVLQRHSGTFSAYGNGVISAAKEFFEAQTAVH
jgi:hypothetical protein